MASLKIFFRQAASKPLDLPFSSCHAWIYDHKLGNERMKTIEPDVQNKLLDILPEDGTLALKVINQLVANMIISIKDANINDFITELKSNIANYEGT